MGENTKVPYVHHSFSPWWGCSHGCPYCFAAKLAHRLGYSEGGTKGHALFGPNSRRRFFGEKRWAEPLKWNERAKKRGVRERVLCATMCDVFESLTVGHPDSASLVNTRSDLWRLIERTPHLDWLLLTKRVDHLYAMWPLRWSKEPPPHVWLGTTIESQPAADKRVDHLLQVPAARHFISYEPALGPLDATPWLGDVKWSEDHGGMPGDFTTSGLDWVIAGCASGAGAPPAEADWFRSLRDQCQEAGVPFFLKQMKAYGKLVKMPELDGRVWDQVPQPNGG